MKKILITGGSGFLGKKLAERLHENYDVWLGARNNKNLVDAASGLKAKCFPLDCSSESSVEDCMSYVQPDTVIHAGATKYVDWSEKYVNECVDINVRGSQNILRSSIKYGVENLLGISTDKACPPVANTYGMSKAIMERMFCLSSSNINPELLKSSNLKICCVRYGNVLYSTGSFLPVWRKMFADNGHIVSTGSNMTRFFFSIDEAVDLVMVALQNIHIIDGSILSLPMKTASVGDFLKAVVDVTSATYEKTVPRDGERIHEILIGESELPFSSEIEFNGKKYYQITPNRKSSNPLPQVISSETSESHSYSDICRYVSEGFKDV